MMSPNKPTAVADDRKIFGRGSTVPALMEAARLLARHGPGRHPRCGPAGADEIRSDTRLPSKYG